MILKDASANEISNAIGLSNKQLFYRLNMLKIKGYNFSRKYYYDGEIVYRLNKDLKKENDICLLTSSKDKEFKAVFISDLHLANKKDRTDLLKQMYEFCVKEGIHIIINSGDIIDGFVGSPDFKRFDSAEEQIEYALKSYPYDNNIINFTCLGNHDYSILENSGQNLETILSIKRHDIVPLGYGIGRLKIKNDEIIVRHPQTPTVDTIEPINNSLIITGHTHKARNTFTRNSINVYVPCLSDLKVKDCSLPGFVKATISFSYGTFSYGKFEQYVFLDKMYKVNESNFELKDKKKDSVIRYEEDRIPYKEKKLKY